MIANSQAAREVDLLSTWQEVRVLRSSPPCWVHEDVAEAIRELEQRFGHRLLVSEVGSSFEGREINLLQLGKGDRKILLWSQMHGDEPSATPALLDLANYLLSSNDPTARSILERFTLLMVPMLNPDGAERATRRSAQGIDVNRDALQLATPEARLLKRLRDQHRPFLGFNLHDQDRRKLVGETTVVATQSLLAVSGDVQQTLTEGRRRAMRVCSVLIGAFEPYIPGGVGRFDEDWSPRAFGDNLTAWGTPIVLLESGGLPPGKNYSYLAGLTFVGLVRALGELARNDAADFTTETYQKLPRNRSDELVDVVLQNLDILVADGTVLRRSFADVAFNLEFSERTLACASPDETESLSDLRRRGVGYRSSEVRELGDTRFLTAKKSLDLSGHLLVPLFRIGLEGPGARGLLSRTNVRRWTRLGVGEILWRVASTELDQASKFAASLDGVDQAAVRVVAEGELPAIVVDRAPTVPAPRSNRHILSDYLDAILGGRRHPNLDPAAVLASGDHLRRFGQASFLVLSPEPTVGVGGETVVLGSDGSNAGEGAMTGELLVAGRVLEREVDSVWLGGRVVRGPATEAAGKIKRAPN